MPNVMESSDKPVAEVWYAVEACDNAILRFRESHIDSYAVGDIWLVRGSERDLAVDTGSGVVAPAPLIEAVAGKPVTAVTLNHSYDHAGGWPSFANRVCHRLDAPFLAAPDVEEAEVADYLNDATLWSLPRSGYSMDDYVLTPAKPTRPVEDGDTLDLGNRSLEVLHVPAAPRAALHSGKRRPTASSPATCSMTENTALPGRLATPRHTAPAFVAWRSCR